MDSRLTANFGPSMVSPGLRLSNVAVMISLPRMSLRPDGPATARTNDVAMLVEEDIVVHHEQPLALDELVERAGLKPDDVAGTRRNIVAPGLTGIDGAGAAHPVIGRRAGKHQQDVDRRRRDQPAITGGFGVDFVEIDRVSFTERNTAQWRPASGCRGWFGAARRERCRPRLSANWHVSRSRSRRRPPWP